MEERTQGLKSESERQASQPSYAASSIVDNKEKLEYSEHNEPVAEDKPAEKPEETVTYAKGAEAVFVMLALLLSITLCSLDQVSSGIFMSTQHCMSPADILIQRPSWQQQSPKSPTNFDN
jgi:hypothetical protein